MANISRKTNYALQEKAKTAGWIRFSQVESVFVPAQQNLYRSSSPSYAKQGFGADSDMTQKLTLKAINFLVEQKIDSIISFNKYEYKPEELEELDKHKIAYSHLPVEDWCAPTVEQLKEANDFFTTKSSTLVHSGYGHGRTGTCVTALQICANNGQTLQPLAGTWWGTMGNHVEKRRQISVLAELRNTLLQNRTKGVPNGPGPRKQFAIINLATGYYLTIHSNAVIALSPEAVETSVTSCNRRQHRWIITKVKDSNNFQLSNSAAAGWFAATKSDGASVNDSVTLGTGKGENTQGEGKNAQVDGGDTEADDGNAEVDGGAEVEDDAQVKGDVQAEGDTQVEAEKTEEGDENTQEKGEIIEAESDNTEGKGENTHFTITEAQEAGDGFYVISPSPNEDLAIAINEPDDSFKRLNDSRTIPALLAPKDDKNKFGLWVLLPVYSLNPLRP